MVPLFLDLKAALAEGLDLLLPKVVATGTLLQEMVEV
jgi:hypothetical protein